MVTPIMMVQLSWLNLGKLHLYDYMIKIRAIGWILTSLSCWQKMSLFLNKRLWWTQLLWNSYSWSWMVVRTKLCRVYKTFLCVVKQRWWPQLILNRSLLRAWVSYGGGGGGVARMLKNQFNRFNTYILHCVHKNCLCFSNDGWNSPHLRASLNYGIKKLCCGHLHIDRL